MKKIITICLIVSIFLSLIGGCQVTGDEHTDGALTGAGVGAIAGQILGRDTKSTLIGAGIGAGTGYLVGGQRKTQRQVDELRTQQQIETVWINNSNGSRTPVHLQKDGYGGYIGPRGEHYSSLPTRGELNQAYGF
jgi:outer membrane lipoprotein SlyB